MLAPAEPTRAHARDRVGWLGKELDDHLGQVSAAAMAAGAVEAVETVEAKAAGGELLSATTPSSGSSSEQPLLESEFPSATTPSFLTEAAADLAKAKDMEAADLTPARARGSGRTSGRTPGRVAARVAKTGRGVLTAVTNLTTPSSRASASKPAPVQAPPPTPPPPTPVPAPALARMSATAAPAQAAPAPPPAPAPMPAPEASPPAQHLPTEGRVSDAIKLAELEVRRLEVEEQRKARELEIRRLEVQEVHRIRIACATVVGLVAVAIAWVRLATPPTMV